MHLRTRGKEGLRLLGWMAIAFVVLSLLNPLFNPAGATVLFTYGLNRPFTLQSLVFGMVKDGQRHATSPDPSSIQRRPWSS